MCQRGEWVQVPELRIRELEEGQKDVDHVPSLRLPSPDALPMALPTPPAPAKASWALDVEQARAKLKAEIAQIQLDTRAAMAAHDTALIRSLMAKRNKLFAELNSL